MVKTYSTIFWTLSAALIGTYAIYSYLCGMAVPWTRGQDNEILFKNVKATGAQSGVKSMHLYRDEPTAST